MTKTAKLMGVLGVYVGMRVRLTDRLWRGDKLVQDAPGTVVGITRHAEEGEEDAAALARGWVQLEYLPDAVLVEFDDHVPRCPTCKARVGACVDGCIGGTPTAGTQFLAGMPPGVFAVKPREKRTDPVRLTRGARLQTFVRYQVPLAPEDVITNQGAQGISANHCLVVIPPVPVPTSKQTPAQIERARSAWWANVYVMLSRCRRLDRLLIANAPAHLADLLELGPPAHVLAEMDRLERLEGGTLRRAAHAREYLGWEARSTEGPGAAPPRPPPVPPHAPRHRGVIHLWDFLPSDATVELRAKLRGQGWEVAGLLEQLQTSSECGYIAAALAARALGGPLPPSDDEARLIARSAIAEVEESNAHLASDDEDVLPGPLALCLELNQVLRLLVHLRNGHAPGPAAEDWGVVVTAADFAGPMHDFTAYLDEDARAEVAELRDGRRQAAGILVTAAPAPTGGFTHTVSHFVAFHLCHAEPEQPERRRPAVAPPAGGRPRKVPAGAPRAAREGEPARKIGRQAGLGEFFVAA